MIFHHTVNYLLMTGEKVVWFCFFGQRLRGSLNGTAQAVQRLRTPLGDTVFL